METEVSFQELEDQLWIGFKDIMTEGWDDAPGFNAWLLCQYLGELPGNIGRINNVLNFLSTRRFRKGTEAQRIASELRETLKIELAAYDLRKPA